MQTDMVVSGSMPAPDESISVPSGSQSTPVCREGHVALRPRIERQRVPYEPMDPTVGPFVTLIPFEGESWRPIRVSRAAIAGTSSDNRVISISSSLIAGQVECTDGDKDDEDVVVHVERVYGRYLEDVVKFVNYHAQNPMEKITLPIDLHLYNTRKETFAESISEFDREFISDSDAERFFRLLEASEYLDIHDLATLMQAAIRWKIKNKSAEEIRAWVRMENAYLVKPMATLTRMRDEQAAAAGI